MTVSRSPAVTLNVGVVLGVAVEAYPTAGVTNVTLVGGVAMGHLLARSGGDCQEPVIVRMPDAFGVSVNVPLVAVLTPPKSQ
jgi:hypothetical protein